MAVDTDRTSHYRYKLAAVGEMNWLLSWRHDQETENKGALSDRLFSLLSALHGNMRRAQCSSGPRRTRLSEFLARSRICPSLFHRFRHLIGRDRDVDASSGVERSHLIFLTFFPTEQNAFRSTPRMPQFKSLAVRRCVITEEATVHVVAYSVRSCSQRSKTCELRCYLVP